MSEAVTVTTEATLLKTDKADVSVDLRPEDVVNLPLNQYRNYQYLMNLVPGATPPEFQNAQTDTPGRSLSVNINGTNRNNNVTRIDGAASINVWLPHHAGYIAPVGDDRERQHLDQQLRLRAGHDRWRRNCGPDEVGDEYVQGLGLLLPSAG